VALPAWFKSKGFWNLPNTITVARCVAVPIMVWLLWDKPGPMEAVLACVVFVVAMLSDVLDGYLARKWGLQSVMGAFLDPLADKLMVIATLVMLVAHGWVEPWTVVVLESRELFIQSLRTIAVSEGMVIPAGSLGKFKTAYQATALGFLLWHYPTKLWVLGLTVDAHACGVLLLWISMGFSVLSATTYFMGFVGHLRAREAAR
jgi:CDP-diacylglycerol--glycerol-3-phosphate 3-phosphatidyltransferase